MSCADAAGWALLALAAPGSFELLLLTAGGLLPARRRAPVSAPLPRTAVVVPAHDEEDGIAATLASVQADIRGDAGIQLVVVADNCRDATAARARQAGARVLVREDPGRRGKGYALEFAFGALAGEGFEAFVVIDADSRLRPGTLGALRSALAGGAAAAQCRYTVANAEASLRTRLMRVALLAFNVLRPRGRDRCGFSAGILGNGFAVSAATLAAVPYAARSVVEDLEYHLRLVRSGRRVRFVDEGEVAAEMPAGGRGARTQRARWDGGRFRMMAAWAPRLVAESVRRPRLLDPLLELLLLPLAFHVTLLAAASLPAATRPWALAGLALTGCHVLAAVARGGGGWRDLAALAVAPFYILWKIALLGAMLRAARRDAPWVRTARGGAAEGKP